MKASHYKTPRTMDECEFQSWGQAVFGRPQPRDFLVPSILIFIAMIGITLCLL